MSVQMASWRHLPVAYAGFVLSFSRAATAKEACDYRSQITEYLAGRAEHSRLLVSHGGLTFAAVEPYPAGGWYLAWIHAWPQRRHHGTEMLTEVCRRADQRRVKLTLHCPSPLVRWYRRFGFLPAPVTRLPRDVAAAKEGLVKLHRPAARQAR